MINKIKQLIDEIFLAVAENRISVESQIVKLAASLLKDLQSESLNNLELPIAKNVNSFRYRGKRTSIFDHVIDVMSINY